MPLISSLGAVIFGPLISTPIPGVDISGPKIDASIGLSGVNINVPKIDISGPKIWAPSLDIKEPKIDSGIGLLIIWFEGSFSND